MRSKIVYMGTPEYAKVILNSLLKDKSFDVNLVLTQPDKPVGRKKILTPPPVKELALKEDIEIFQPTTLKSKEVVEKIKSKKPDFIVVAAYGIILPREILDIAPCINLHASLLPKYRGASPVQEAILNGDRFSGVTAMLMEEGLDSGDMLSFSYIKLNDKIRVDELMERLSILAGDLIVDTLKSFSSLKPLAQIDATASYCKKIKRGDGLVSFDLSAEEIYRRFRAFYGWPEIFLDSGLKLKEIDLADEVGSSGEILKVNKNSIIVGCKSGSIEIKELQPKGKKVMSAKAYLVGRGLKVGDKIY